MRYRRSPRFSVVDGLVILDLRQTHPTVLERYMGKPGLASFRRYHSLEAAGTPANS